MDNLGERIVQDRAEIDRKRHRALELAKEASRLNREADEMERLLALARLEK